MGTLRQGLGNVEQFPDYRSWVPEGTVKCLDGQGEAGGGISHGYVLRQKRTSLNQWIIWEASALNVSGAVRLVGTGPGTLGRPRLTSMGRDVGF